MKLGFITLLMLHGLFSTEMLAQSSIDSLNETRVMNAIWQLDAVQERNDQVVELSEGKRELFLLLYKTPEETENGAYWVKIVEDNGSSYVSHFNFFIYPNDGKTTFYDTINDLEIDVEEWQKQEELER